MDPSVGDPPSDLPYLHYMTERDRINRYLAIKCTTVLASLPERCLYRARSSPKNAKKLALGWLKFHSPEPELPTAKRRKPETEKMSLEVSPLRLSTKLRMLRRRCPLGVESNVKGSSH